LDAIISMAGTTDSRHPSPGAMVPSVAFQGYRDDGLRLVTGNRACEVCSVGFTARSHAQTCSPRRRQGEDDDESVSIGHADPSFRPQRRYPPAVPGVRSNWLLRSRPSCPPPSIVNTGTANPLTLAICSASTKCAATSDSAPRVSFGPTRSDEKCGWKSMATCNDRNCSAATATCSRPQRGGRPRGEKG